LATPQKHKLASGRKSTRQNLDGKLITPVNDPEIFLRVRGSFEATATVYKPKNPPLKTKCPSEASTSYSPRFDTKNPTWGMGHGACPPRLYTFVYYFTPFGKSDLQVPLFSNGLLYMVSLLLSLITLFSVKETLMNFGYTFFS
jgi:hypothetical protein